MNRRRMNRFPKITYKKNNNKLINFKHTSLIYGNVTRNITNEMKNTTYFIIMLNLINILFSHVYIANKNNVFISTIVKNDCFKLTKDKNNI